jgi:hypothetical protein
VQQCSSRSFPLGRHQGFGPSPDTPELRDNLLVTNPSSRSTLPLGLEIPRTTTLTANVNRMFNGCPSVRSVDDVDIVLSIMAASFPHRYQERDGPVVCYNFTTPPLASSSRIERSSGSARIEIDPLSSSGSSFFFFFFFLQTISQDVRGNWNRPRRQATRNPRLNTTRPDLS